MVERNIVRPCMFSTYSNGYLTSLFQTFATLAYRVKQQSHSTVSFVRCKGVVESANVIFHFSITYRRPSFTVPRYSQYQFFLYETIIEQREKEKTFDQIADGFKQKRVSICTWKKVQR